MFKSMNQVFASIWDEAKNLINVGTPSLDAAANAAAVVKSDATVFAPASRAVYVGTGGDVVATIGGTDVTFKNVPNAALLPIAATKIKAATTAADMVRLW